MKPKHATNHVFAQTTHMGLRMWSLTASEYILNVYSTFHQNSFRGFGATWGRICPFPLLWLLAFTRTTACTTVQTVMYMY